MIGWKGRSSLTAWCLGTVTVVFLAYQWLPIFTLGLLSFSGPTGGTTFPMNGTSLHWYQELWRASVMNDFKPPLLRSVLLALACSATNSSTARSALASPASSWSWSPEPMGSP